MIARIPSPDSPLYHELRDAHLSGEHWRMSIVCPLCSLAALRREKPYYNGKEV